MYLLRPSDYRRMPWKNGAGETIEIAVSPRGASVSDFDWRISMAHVGADGPFSVFPGIDRTLSILDGEGIVLSVGDAPPVTLTGSTSPFSFPADVPTSATLIAGPVLDFNVMSRRGALSHRVRRLDLTKMADLRFGGMDQLVFCTRGAVVLDVGLSRVDLGEGETLHRSGGDTGIVLRPDGAAIVFVIEIGPA